MVAHLVQRDDGGITVRAGVGVHVDVEGPDVVGQHRLVYRDVTGQRTILNNLLLFTRGD